MSEGWKIRPIYARIWKTIFIYTKIINMKAIIIIMMEDEGYFCKKDER